MVGKLPLMVKAVQKNQPLPLPLFQPQPSLLLLKTGIMNLYVRQHQKTLEAIWMPPTAALLSMIPLVTLCQMTLESLGYIVPDDLGIPWLHCARRPWNPLVTLCQKTLDSLGYVVPEDLGIPWLHCARRPWNPVRCLAQPPAWVPGYLSHTRTPVRLFNAQSLVTKIYLCMFGCHQNFRKRPRVLLWEFQACSLVSTAAMRNACFVLYWSQFFE